MIVVAMNVMIVLTMNEVKRFLRRKPALDLARRALKIASAMNRIARQAAPMDGSGERDEGDEGAGH